MTCSDEGEQRRIAALQFKRLADDETIRRLETDALDPFGCWRDSATTYPAPTGEPIIEVTDFDAVVLAVGIDDLRILPATGGNWPPVGWDTMMQEVRTVATQSAQVWLSKSLYELGWYRGSALITALGVEFDTWADMTHTLAAESAWRASKAGKPSELMDRARSVGYFCAPLPEATIEALRRDKDAIKKAIEANCDRLLEQGAAGIWPLAYQKRTAAELELHRYVQPNFERSDRYTLSLPGSPAYRLSPLDRLFENATIAGDWTACGLDAGCIEAAVMSGMLAAHAISGRPELDRIVGYDHP